MRKTVAFQRDEAAQEAGTFSVHHKLGFNPFP